MATFWAILLISAQIAGFLSSIHALMSVRTPQGAIAWVISLNAISLVAVPAYWVLGRSKFQGYVTARKAEDSALSDKLREAATRVKDYQIERPDERGGIHAAEQLAKMPFTARNQVDLLIDGAATFDSILAGIDGAREYILFQFYIIRDDGLGQRLADALLRKAREGVRVFYLYDEVGSHELPDTFIQRLEQGGVRVCHFHSTRGAGNRFQINFRNHRKVVVVDGRVGWVGGHNVGDEYLGKSPKFGAWRDTHVRIAGPSVLGLQVSFLEDWNWATDEKLELSWIPRTADEGDMQVLILPTGPADESEAASLMFQHAIHSARERVWIASPYFVPDEGVSGALKIAKLRGVDVRILIPDRPDHLLVYMSAFAFVGEMLKQGIEVHRYLPGFLHQKVFLLDDSVVGVGTANLDNRSFRLNFEVTAIVADDEFAREAERMLIEDFARARPMTLDELVAKPFWFRVAARAAYLSAPIL